MMNSHDTYFVTSQTKLAQPHFLLPLHQRLTQYLFCAGLGLLSGITSVAVIIATMVAGQVLLFPAIEVSPSAIWLTVGATLISFGISWLMVQAVQRLQSNLLKQAQERGVQIIFTLGILTSLIESVLFFHGLQ